MPVGKNMEQSRGQTAQQVKKQIPYRTQAVLHIVPKNVQGPHIPKEMQQSPVEEHKGEKGEDLVREGKIVGDLRDRVSGRDEPVIKNESVQTPALGHLHKIDQDVHGDEQGVYDRIVGRAYCVPKGYHEGGPQRLSISPYDEA
jgi:hypothetical protein